ncbi:MAG: UDP-N-acetylmuramoyl-L-alanyl-D-glutamate--2,6-diaminopimelate ligase [Ruminococcaceae bacterium]|nr:UDP-N-acetylmuramoyl-L-alanyl-D-glutamate--2,6-diaminopimelate ligase [Oscillospiraceae bacterium]
MILGKLLEGCGAKGDYNETTDVSSVCFNSKKVTKGALFAALKGSKADGRDYIAEAAEKGASCVLCEGEISFSKIPVIRVENVRSAAAKVCSNFYGNPDRDMKIIAVTGTNGKTTVCALLEYIYGRAGRKTGMLGTVYKRGGGEELDCGEDNMTTPDPEKLYGYLRKIKDAGCDTVIMEASSHALAHSKLDGMHIDLGLFTNLTPEHLDFHGSMENYYRAKSLLAKKSKSFLVNYDDHYGKRLCDEFPRALAVSATPETAADRRVWATAAMYRDHGFYGIEYMFCCRETVFPVMSVTVGKNALYNTLLSSAAALYGGIEPHIIANAVAEFRGISGRFETVCFGHDVPRVIIDYAHTPDSFERVLSETRQLTRELSKLTVVFGCGGERDKGKRPVMGAIAEKYAHRVIITDDNPRGEEPSEIRRDILDGIKDKKKICVIGDRKEALESAVYQSSAGDVILVLGKGHEEYIIDKNGRHPFPEREIIKNAVFNKFGTL